MKCIVDLDGIESEDDAPDTSYYQWVTFMFVIQVTCDTMSSMFLSCVVL